MGIRWKLYSLAGGALAAEVAAYLLWRPRMLRWGATAKEASEPLPGDDRTPHPRVQSTRAVTIDAPPEQVWPWLMQMGIGRAGFYTHDWVERLMFRARYVEGKHSATRIHPEIPPLRAGDTIPMGAGAFATVSEAEPYRHLVAQETYVLRPLAGNKTRLIARYRGAGFVSPAAHAIRPDAGRLPRLRGSPSFTSPASIWPCAGSTCPSPTPCITTWRPGCSPGSRPAQKGSTPMPATLTRRPPPWSPWQPRTDAAPEAVAARPRLAVLAAVKTVHTLACDGCGRTPKNG